MEKEESKIEISTKPPFTTIDLIFDIITTFLEAKKDTILEKVKELKEKYGNQNNRYYINNCYRQNFIIHNASIFDDDIQFYNTILDEVTTILNIYSQQRQEILLKYQDTLYFLLFVIKILKIIKLSEPDVLLTPNFKFSFIIIVDMFYYHKDKIDLYKSEDIFLLFNTLNQFHFILKGNFEKYLPDEVSSAQKEKEELIQNIKAKVQAEVTNCYNQLLEENDLKGENIHQASSMYIKDFHKEEKDWENKYIYYQTVFKEMKVSNFIKMKNEICKNNLSDYTLRKYFPIFEEIFIVFSSSSPLTIVMMKYFTDDKKFPTEKSKLSKIQNIIEKIIGQVVNVFQSNQELHSIENILSNNAFQTFFFEVLQTDLVQSFFNNRSKNKYTIGKPDFFQKNIKTLILPGNIMGFTNRYLIVFLNKIGFTVSNIENDEQKQILFQALVLLILLHEITYFLKIFEKDGTIFEECEIVRENTIKEDGRLLFDYLFGFSVIKKISLIQAKQLLSIDSWKEKSVQTIFKEEIPDEKQSKKEGKKQSKIKINFMFFDEDNYCYRAKQYE